MVAVRKKNKKYLFTVEPRYYSQKRAEDVLAVINGMVPLRLDCTTVFSRRSAISKEISRAKQEYVNIQHPPPPPPPPQLPL